MCSEETNKTFAFLCATGYWVHAACLGVTMKDYKPFKAPSISWCCPACTPTIAPQPPTTTQSPEQNSSPWFTQSLSSSNSSPSTPLPLRQTVSKPGSSQRGVQRDGGVPPARDVLVVHAHGKPAIRPLSYAHEVSSGGMTRTTYRAFNIHPLRGVALLIPPLQLQKYLLKSPQNSRCTPSPMSISILKYVLHQKLSWLQKNALIAHGFLPKRGWDLVRILHVLFPRLKNLRQKKMKSF